MSLDTHNAVAFEAACSSARVRALTACGPEAGAGSPAFYQLDLDAPGFGPSRPGQFLMLRPEAWGQELTWGRPFSLCEVWEEEGAARVRVFFQVVGRGTARLAQLKAGDEVTVWGPLGNGFALEPETETLLLAGGVGLAPFVGYALEHPAPERLRLLFGHRPELACYPYARIASRIACEQFREQCAEDIACFVDLLAERVRDYRHGLILACGPLPFLRTVQRLALELGARAQLSLENRMACGVGACLGCVSPDKTGWPVQVCTKGPVFWAQDISLEGA